MTILEYKAKPLASEADALEAIRSSEYGLIKSYVTDGSDAKVATLLQGLWLARGMFTSEQMMEVILLALFGDGTLQEIRWATATKTLMFAKALSMERELKNQIIERWPTLSEMDVRSFSAGLHCFDGIERWIPLLPKLFDLSSNYDVRSALVKALDNIERAKHLPEARKLLVSFVERMPSAPNAYVRPRNFEFVTRLKSELKEYLNN